MNTDIQNPFHVQFKQKFLKMLKTGKHLNPTTLVDRHKINYTEIREYLKIGQDFIYTDTQRYYFDKNIITSLLEAVLFNGYFLVQCECWLLTDVQFIINLNHKHKLLNTK